MNLHPDIAGTLANTRRYGCVKSDCIEFFYALPDDSIDMLCCSPPYADARTYEDGRDDNGKVTIRGQDWVDWMVALVRAAAPKVKGLIAINCEGRTEDFKYSATPFLLMADLHRAGFNLRKPFVFNRVGIPGSGGPDWLRNDWEPVICITRPGRLPWSDPLACGHKPKWAPGGEMSHRMTDGTRRNQWGGGEKSTGGERRQDGSRADAGRPMAGAGPPKLSLFTGFDEPEPEAEPAVTERNKRKNFSEAADGSVKGEHERDICAIANPGNVLKFHVVGNLMGHPSAHRNEAPYPLGLPRALIMMYCPLDVIVVDCYSGSGTTAEAAIEQGRRFIGCDDRQSQVDITNRRARSVTPSMLTLIPEERNAEVDAELWEKVG